MSLQKQACNWTRHLSAVKSSTPGLPSRRVSFLPQTSDSLSVLQRLGWERERERAGVGLRVSLDEQGAQRQRKIIHIHKRRLWKLQQVCWKIRKSRLFISAWHPAVSPSPPSIPPSFFLSLSILPSCSVTISLALPPGAKWPFHPYLDICEGQHLTSVHKPPYKSFIFPKAVCDDTSSV